MVGLVMFQLAIGLQWKQAQAGAAAGEVAAGHCAAHAHAAVGKATRLGGGVSSASSTQQIPGTQHDCCRSPGCQCHCVQTPVMTALTLGSPALSSARRVPVFDARLPVARTNQLFRPPIG